MTTSTAKHEISKEIPLIKTHRRRNLEKQMSVGLLNEYENLFTHQVLNIQYDDEALIHLQVW